jgi:capsular polysaccharide biosynthesis protein
MQLSRLKPAVLKVATKTKQANGSYVEEYTKVTDYKVILQELVDEVSASMYGANLNKTYRVSSPRETLEIYLQGKLNNTSDNISKYFLFIQDKQYKIVSVKEHWVDIELNG